jgi:hypothetical protein
VRPLKRRTLVERVGIVQMAVALVALTLVALLTSLTVTTVLTRKTDEALEQVAARVTGVLEGLARRPRLGFGAEGNPGAQARRHESRGS